MLAIRKTTLVSKLKRVISDVFVQFRTFISESDTYKLRW